MLGAGPGDPGEHSYTELVDALRQRGSQPAADIEELWRRIAFSILITNVDDHLLNHGYLHVDRGQWRLAPAFDVNPFPDRVQELKTWLSEEAGPEATIAALMSVTAYFRISRDRAKTILADVEAAVANNWRDEGRAIGMTAKDPGGLWRCLRGMKSVTPPGRCCNDPTGARQLPAWDSPVHRIVIRKDGTSAVVRRLFCKA